MVGLAWIMRSASALISLFFSFSSIIIDSSVFCRSERLRRWFEFVRLFWRLEVEAGGLGREGTYFLWISLLCSFKKASWLQVFANNQFSLEQPLNTTSNTLFYLQLTLFEFEVTIYFTAIEGNFLDFPY